MSVSTLPEPSDPPAGLAARAHRWVGHRAPLLSVASYLFQAAAYLTRDAEPVTSVLLGLLGLALVWWPLAGMIRHDARLCGACLGDMPVDGPERAERRYRRLWYFHATHGVIGLTARALLLAACLAVRAPTVPALVGIGVWMVNLAVGVPALLAFAGHRRVAPWCPYCGWENGGGVVLPGPDPAIPAVPPG